MSSPLNPMQMQVVSGLDECPRCHEFHEPITFVPLMYAFLVEAPRDVAAADVVLTHWSMCPNMGQPILVGYHDGRWQAG